MDDDVITTITTGARTRNAAELSTQIQAAGGALTVNANDSNYIVAVNNGLRFSVTKLENEQYRVTESFNSILLIALAGIVGIVLLSRR